eukprot:3888635-Rhodomonas_salina.2
MIKEQRQRAVAQGQRLHPYCVLSASLPTHCSSEAVGPAAACELGQLCPGGAAGGTSSESRQPLRSIALASAPAPLSHSTSPCLPCRLSLAPPLPIRASRSLSLGWPRPHRVGASQGFPLECIVA